MRLIRRIFSLIFYIPRRILGLLTPGHRHHRTAYGHY